MKAVVAAFKQEKALVGAFSVITNLRICFGWNFLKHGNYTQHTLPRPPLPRQLVPGEGEVRDLRGAAVLETRRLAAGEEAVEVGAGAARPRDLPRAQRRRHDVAPRRAAVARLAAVVPHAEAAMTSLVTS